MPLLRLRTLHTCEKAIVSTRGDIDLASAPTFETQLTEEVNGGHKNVIVNLAHTSYIDSSGLAVLLRMHRTLQGAGGKLAVIGCQPNVSRVFRMVGFQHLF